MGAVTCRGVTRASGRDTISILLNDKRTRRGVCHTERTHLADDDILSKRTLSRSEREFYDRYQLRERESTLTYATYIPPIYRVNIAFLSCAFSSSNWVSRIIFFFFFEKTLIRDTLLCRTLCFSDNNLIFLISEIKKKDR